MEPFKIILAGILATILLVSMSLVAFMPQDIHTDLQNNEESNLDTISLSEKAIQNTDTSSSESGTIDIFIEDYAIPTGESRTGSLYIQNMTDCVIVTLNLSWNPSVLTYVDINDTDSPFDMILSSDGNGFVKITAYKFNDGLYGDEPICLIEFTSAPGATDGDWTTLTSTSSAVWNSSLQFLDHQFYPGNATIYGNMPEMMISGHVFEDTNENGTQDPGEPGLNGWEIQLDDTISTLTNDTGYYEFTGLTPDTYTIKEILIGECWQNTTPSEMTVDLTECNGSVNFGNKDYTSDSTLTFSKKASQGGIINFQDDTLIIDSWDERFIIFKLTITADGPFTDVWIEDELPEGLTYNHTYTQPGWTTPDYYTDTYVYWEFSNVSDTWTQTLLFRADINEGFYGTINNTGLAIGANDCMDDYIVQDSVTLIINHDESDGLLVEKRVSSSCEEFYYDEITVDYEDMITYKIDITINTIDDLFNLTVKDNLPSLYPYDFITSWVLYNGLFLSEEDYIETIVDDQLVWYFNYEDVSILPGTQITIFYCVNVYDCGIFENTVNVSGQINPCCPEGWISNQDSAVVEIICPSGVLMNKTVSYDGITWLDEDVDVMVDDILWFKLYIKNIGFDPVTGVQIFDTLPSHLILEEVVDANGALDYSIDDQNLRWLVDDLDGLETHEIIYKARVIDLGSGHNSACVNYSCSEEWCDQIWVNVTEGLHLDKQVSPDEHGPWTEHITANPGDMIWWNISLDYSTSQMVYGNYSLILYDIIIEDILPEGLSYHNNTATLLKYDGWTMMMNPEINGQTLTWDLTDNLNCSLENNTWLSLVFATDISTEINGTLTNRVNVTAKQCNHTDVFKQDSASVIIEEITNHAPTITNPSPEDNAVNVSIDNTMLSIDVNDSDDDLLIVSFFDASDDSEIATSSNVNPPKTVTATWDNLEYNTTYNWYVAVNDSVNLIYSKGYSFTTEQEPDNQAPVIEPDSPTPSDGATNIGKNPWIAVHVSDPNPEDTLTITFYTSTGTQIDTDTCSDDCTATVQWTGLDFDTTYSWYVIVSDGLEEVRGPATGFWSFTTETPDIDLAIQLIGGRGITMEIENTGTDSATDIAWTLEVVKKGIFGKEYTPQGNVIPLLGAGITTTKSFTYFGFGRINITATAACDYAIAPDVSVNGFILGPFIFIR